LSSDTEEKEERDGKNNSTGEKKTTEKAIKTARRKRTNPLRFPVSETWVNQKS